MAKLETARGWLLLLLALTLLSGCAAWDHAMQARDVAGRPLDVRSAEGRQRLDMEASFDASVAEFLARESKPDYLFVESRARLYFFYVKSDRVVMFERDLQESQVSDLGRIPGSLLRKLPDAVRQQLIARRKAASKRAKVAHARRAQAQPVPAKAASGGAYFGAFDVEALADRMRDQPTAADPGVRTWKRSTLPDGRRRLFAKKAGNRYEVRPDSASVAGNAGPKTRSLPRSLRLGIARVNRAVFQNKAEAVSRAVLPYVKKVLADPSGRTRVTRRVEGRTVKIERRPADGIVIYSLHP